MLGGPPRTAKTMIMSGLITKKHVPFVAADAVVHGLRNVLTGEPHQMLRDIEISGSAERKTSSTDAGQRESFSNNGTESELTLRAMTGMLDYYRRNNESVAFEGAAFTPEWVGNLKLEGFVIRAAFVGYTNSVHADKIITYAKQNPHDWINAWLKKEGGDETKIREWVARQAEECQKLKSDAEQRGFPFFDISTTPFSEYVASAQNYFLES